MLGVAGRKTRRETGEELDRFDALAFGNHLDHLLAAQLVRGRHAP